MKLCLKNIGKLDDVTVKLNGITVIAGENNTGKSTVGKALYLYLHSLNNIDNYVEDDIIETLKREMRQPMDSFDLLCRELSNAARRHKVAKADEIRQKYAREIYENDNTSQLIRELAKEHANLYGLNLDTIKEKNYNALESWEKEIESRINAVLELDDDKISARKVTSDINQYFDGDIITIGKDNGMICVDYENGRSNQLHFLRDKKMGRDDCDDISRQENVTVNPIYIESPKTIDQLHNLAKNKSKIYDVFKEILAPNMLCKDVNEYDIESYAAATITQQEQNAALLKEFYSNVSDIVGGSLQFNAVNGLQFQERNNKRYIDISNLSNGIKSLILLEYAIEAGCLGKGDFLILDEPEINLHPEWQLEYARMIIQLQNQLDLTVIMTTHTPYFLEAIEVFSQKYGVKERCSYYLAENNDNIVEISDVTDDIEQIYVKLARPFQILDRERESFEKI